MLYQEVRQNFTTRENGQKSCARRKVNSDKNRYFAHCVLTTITSQLTKLFDNFHITTIINYFNKTRRLMDPEDLDNSGVT